MTFDEFWKQSGWHSSDEEVGGTSEYNLAKDAYDAGRANVAALQTRVAELETKLGQFQHDDTRDWV